MVDTTRPTADDHHADHRTNRFADATKSAATGAAANSAGTRVG
jgi:hypothetical protein